MLLKKTTKEKRRVHNNYAITKPCYLFFISVQWSRLFSGVIILNSAAAGLLLKISGHFLCLPSCEYVQSSYLRFPCLWYSEGSSVYIYFFFLYWSFYIGFLFFLPVCLLASLGTDPNPSENQWTALQSDSWLLFLWDYCHQRLLSSELILDLKDFILNSMFKSKSLGFIVMILCVYGHSFNSYIYFSTGFQQDFCLQWES